MTEPRRINLTRSVIENTREPVLKPAPRDPFNLDSPRVGQPTDLFGIADSQSLEDETAAINQALGDLNATLTSAVEDQKPVNQKLIARADTYRASIAPRLRPDIEKVQEFFLNEVLPLMMAAHNGLADGVDVARLSLDAEPAASQFIHFFNDLIREAVKAKTVCFVQSLAAMSPDAEALFLSTYRALTAPKGSTNDSDIPALLHEVLKVHDMQRPVQGKAKVLMRKVPTDEGGQQPARSGRSKPSPKGKRGSTGTKRAGTRTA